MKLSIIIPAHNEEKRIGRTLENYSSYFEELRKKNILDYEFVIVVNGTKDNTLEIVKSFSKKNKRILYLNLVKGGKGYAVLEGFKSALTRKNDLIGFVDADMATDPESFYFLIKNMPKEGAAIASRYIKGSIVSPKQTFARIFTSRVYNSLIRGLFLMPYRDTQCGAKVFTRKAIEKIINKIGMTKWAFDLDLIYHVRKEGLAIKELPTKWSDKEYSKINFLISGPWMALAVVRFRLINSLLKRFIRIYDKFIGFMPR